MNLRKPFTPTHSLSAKRLPSFSKIKDEISFSTKVYSGKIQNTSKSIYPPSPIPIQKLLKHYGHYKMLLNYGK